MNTFLYEVIEQLIAENGIGGLVSHTIVVPSRRAMLHVKDCFREYMTVHNLKGPIQLPRLTTLSSLFDELSPLYKIDEIQLVCTLYDVYNQVEKDALPNKDVLPLDVFYGWGRQLVQDFSNIDKTYPLVTPEKFLNNAAAANILSQLDIDDEVRERLEQLVSDNPSAIVSGSKRQEFEVIWSNLLAIYTSFRSALGQYGYEGARMKSVIEHWDEESIQRKIAGQHFVFAGFNYLVPAEKQLMLNLQEANSTTFFWDYPQYESFTANSKAFKWIKRNAEFFGNAAKQSEWTTKEVQLVSTVSSHAQAQYAYQWLRDNHHAGERSAIIICDESVLEQIIYALPQDAPEEANPRFKHINITKGFPLRQTEIYGRLMNWLDEGKSLDDFIADTRLTLPKTEESDEQDMFVNASFTDLLAVESTFQLLSHLSRFRQMQETGKVPANLPRRTQNTLLRRYLSAISFPFHGEPLADVQITGVLETRAMDFDNILLLNVEEGIVPNVTPDHSYLPYYLRKYYGLQTHEESTDVYAYNFFRLLTRAKKITMTFAGSETGNNRKTMSRFVKQIMASDNFLVTKEILLEDNSTVPFTFSPLALTDSSLVGQERETKRFLSPSAINMFRQCEMKYFIRYRLGIHELEEEDALLSHAELGTHVHNAMQEIYTRYRSIDKVPNPLDYSQINALEDISVNHPVELATVKTFIERILQADRLLAKKGLRILDMEKDVYWEVNIPPYGNVKIGGRIDRIDKVGEQVRIVDYKTGKLKPENEVQINIYRLAYQQQHNVSVTSALYLCRNNKPEELVYEVTLKDEQAFIDELTETVRSILSLDQPKMAEKDSECRFCPYKLLCNRHPMEF